MSENAPLQGGSASDFQQRARIGHARSGTSKFAGRDAGQRHQMTPPEGRTRGSEFIRHGAVEFFRVERAVFTDGEAQQEIENRPRFVAELAVAINDRAGVRLEISADRLLGFLQQARRISRRYRLHLAGDGERLPVEKIPAALNPVERHLVRAEDQAGDAVPRI